MKLIHLWVIMSMLACGWQIQKNEKQMNGAVLAMTMISSVLWPIVAGQEAYEITNKQLECKK